ncbi:MAG: transposase [Cenarchaeum sp. SB0665_bin_23]|nr:transposase [Cenarchaeum sp. SB0665_bin_23]MYG33085.1 transposase [Cenarchaeum sp. SB0677_bin_16]
MRPIEVHLGGREKNKKGKRKKPTFVGIRDKETDTIRAILVPEPTTARLVAFIDANVDPESKKFTDETRIYNDLKNHHTVCHSDGECIRGAVYLSRVESFCNLVRRGYNGTFHRFEPKHLHRHINKFAGRLGTKALSAVYTMYRIWWTRASPIRNLWYPARCVAGRNPLL